jgi:hypothetical protein
MNDDNNKWINEFSTFMNSEERLPSNEVSNTIIKKVHKDINPTSLKVFSKIGIVQAVIGLITLTFCPQFGFSLTGNHGITHFMMRFGETVCIFGCGIIFIGSSLLVSAFVLSRDEMRVLRSHKILQIGILSLLTLGAFYCFGAQIFEAVTIAWMIGSLAGGIASLELGWSARNWMKEKVIYG